MAKNKRTVRQQMKYWRVGRGSCVLRIRARTARAAARIYMRGNLEHMLLCREHELDNPNNPSADMPSTVIRERGMRQRVKRWAKAVTIDEVPVERW